MDECCSKNFVLDQPFSPKMMCTFAGGPIELATRLWEQRLDLWAVADRRHHWQVLTCTLMAFFKP